MVKKVFRFEDLEFWADGGRVVIANIKKAEDSTRPVYEVIRSVDPKEFMKRVMAVCVMTSKLLPSEQRKARKLYEEAEIVIKQALSQEAKLETNKVVKLETPPELLFPGVSYRFKQKPARDIILNGYELEPVKKLYI